MARLVADRIFLEELRGQLPKYLRMTARGAAIRGKICCVDPNHLDSTPSMGYDFRHQRLHCFGCGKSFDLLDLIGLDHPSCKSFPQRIEKACCLLSIPLPQGDVRKGAWVVPRAFQGGDFTSFVENCIRVEGVGGEYFTQRGIPPVLCEKYQLFQWNGYAYMPILRAGRCVAYCARRMGSGEPRYRNSPGAMEIFGNELLKKEEEKCLVVTESIFDALSAEVCGFSAIALCGVGNINRFLDLCKSCARLQERTFLLAGDRDAAGSEMNQKLKEELTSLGVTTRIIVLEEGQKDLNDALVSSREALEDALASACGKHRVVAGRRLVMAARAPSGDCVESGPISTGITTLDGLLGGGLFPGLYVLGAVSSLGKTSLVLQIGDSIAQQGRDVLYFTLEMSGVELVSKSLSRLTAQIDGTVGKSKSLSVQQISQGKNDLLLDKATEVYEKAIGKHVFFVEEILNIEGLLQTVRSHMQQRKKRHAPVVIVDYLQILQPVDGRGTDKQNTDRAVVALKRLSRECSTSVLVISSFNRENYKSPVSMEAFKESGAVEYSSDVLLGLQPVGIGEPRFDMNAAKMRNPREVTLVLLKNRTGVPYGVVPLRYYAKFSLFTEK